jgi:uncharacterized Zn finger protein
MMISNGVVLRIWILAGMRSVRLPLWLTLADRRKLSHPAEVLPIYQREVELLIQQTGNADYASAIHDLKTVRDLMIKLDREPDFQMLIAQLQKTYKGKRNFVTLLRNEGW